AWEPCGTLTKRRSAGTHEFELAATYQIVGGTFSVVPGEKSQPSQEESGHCPQLVRYHIRGTISWMGTSGDDCFLRWTGFLHAATADMQLAGGLSLGRRRCAFLRICRFMLV